MERVVILEGAGDPLMLDDSREDALGGFVLDNCAG